MNTQIKRIGRNKYQIGKQFYTSKSYNEILEETQRELQDFNFNFLINWEETNK